MIDFDRLYYVDMSHKVRFAEAVRDEPMILEDREYAASYYLRTVDRRVWEVTKDPDKFDDLDQAREELLGVDQRLLFDFAWYGTYGQDVLRILGVR